MRVDRTELSKNIGRGLLAYAELLRRYPEWLGKVVHIASAYPSRHDLPAYREYTGQVQRLAADIENEFGTDDWRPVILHVTDDYARSLALYRAGDVLLCNPVRDGMNLVAKEVPVLSERGCAVVLSIEAGAADELGADSLLVNPFDVSGTADALDAALRMPAAERRARTDRMAKVAVAAATGPVARRPGRCPRLRRTGRDSAGGVGCMSVSRRPRDTSGTWGTDVADVARPAPQGSRPAPVVSVSQRQR